ncbi:lipoate-protein ligase a, putative [Ichthyophthirius multifiliis]|uniref:Lipoate-protein ligase a, putative n=1 Tax=Ichthyophthirius multifiliis TaxID=5932 RepID=G0R589_ICHMU|nr:lipoate-protein ligase a, putative [Ichthyophthirius multifiliis]EGR27366.1 lipoate-protein ligase a, putative [Ichthyophthirius multifiliis]|eukprot:XP_004024250.1 lipoate-protein ligase a, putative [Ichthyophthirius multifiliis]
MKVFKTSFNFSKLNKHKHQKVEIYYTDSHNIYFNLALEQSLYENNLVYPRLMLWKNDQSIIIGKYQNQWKECNMFNLINENVPFIRRKTGGGTVYHDLGNICFTFITPIFDKDIYSLDPRQDNVQILQSAMNILGISTGLTKRKDLTFKEKKISGSAYQANMGNKQGDNKKCLHHGTLLLNADIKKLWKYINTETKNINCKGQESVISQVCNLRDFFQDLSDEKVFEAISDAFINFYQVQNFEVLKSKNVNIK